MHLLTIERLIKKLGDRDDEGGQFDAATELECRGDTAMSALICELGTEDLLRRYWATVIVGEITTRAAIVVPLLVRLLADADCGIQAAAAEALGRYGHAAAAARPALLNLVDCHAEELVRAEALWAWSCTGVTNDDKLSISQRVVNDPDPEVRSTVAQILRYVGGAPALLLLQQLGCDESKLLREQVACTIATLNTPI